MRLKNLELVDMNEAQRRAVAEVISGRRGKVPAPMLAWLRNPELARRGQALGELLRFETSLSADLSELAILVCGRHWTSHHEWTAHKKIALGLGLNEQAISAIAAGMVPQLDNTKQETVYLVASRLLSQGKLDEAIYRRGCDELSEQGLVELVAIIGYYSLVALTLNAFEIGLPENLAPELEARADGNETENKP